VSTQIEFGPEEELAAFRLIDIALAEDLGLVSLGAVPALVDLNPIKIGTSLEPIDLSGTFSMTTLDPSLDHVTIPPKYNMECDLTCAALVDPEAWATIDVVIRREGVLAGVPVAELVFPQLEYVNWVTLITDGSTVRPGDVIARVDGPLRSLLIGERTALNFLMHLSGVATQTRRFVDAIAGTKAVILDTRKTLPGWRLLEKYAVRCGGGTNHRMGLSDGVLIKDNHLAAWMSSANSESRSIAAAVRQARRRSPEGVSIEVEVDTLEQLRDALAGSPDIVLLDNMGPPQLREAVELRDQLARTVLLEASGGITLANVREIAECGVDRISVGALTHSAPALDIAFDWHVQQAR
jgi:nicotinate-nucleotide pyrophosphorylase (carboxylating)